MNFGPRTLTVGLAAFTVAGAVASLVVVALAAHRRAGSPAARARHLAWLRLLPATVAIAAAVTVVAAFLLFEPRRPQEYLGWSVQALAGLGFAVLATAAWRSAKLAAATRRLTRAWRAAAEPVALDGISVPALAVTAPFPIVAVLGLRRPTLVIARSVLAACTPDELRAILAHEQGHIDRRDNLRRLLLAVSPDVVAWLPASDWLFAEWSSAAEEAADDDAARAGAAGRLHLASALVKVARLATGHAAADVMPASTLYCGHNLDGRVRRLLEPPCAGAGAGAGDRPPLTRIVATLAAAAVVATVALQGLHAVIETAIRTLP